jgi:hypothetical protein
MTDLNAKELQEQLLKIRENLVSKIERNDDKKYPVIVWATLASIVSRLGEGDSKFADILHYKSNSYREEIQNSEIKSVFHHSLHQKWIFVDLFHPR